MSLNASPTSIASLSTFSGSPFYALDEFHLLAEGISTQFRRLIHYQDCLQYIPKSCSSEDYTFAYKDKVKVAQMEDVISNAIVKSAKYVPTSFQGSWSKTNGYYRGVDWLDYLLYAIPTIVIPYLRHESTKIALMRLINGCTLALQWNITARDVSKMNE